MKIKEITNNKEFSKGFYIYAETSFIHEGVQDYLIKLIDGAKKAQCDGIKFQILIDKDDSYNINTEIYHKLDNWCFDRKTWLDIVKYAKNMDLDVIVLPLDLQAIQFCKTNIRYIDCIEVHSVCFNDHFMLKELAEMADIPIILGIGGRTLDEIDYALDILSFNKNLILMYGFQSFPTKIENINLSKVKKYGKLYDLPIGYADHTKFNDEYGDTLFEYSYLMDARIFEKHITLKKGETRVDYESAVEYKDILRIRQKLNKLIKVIGEDSRFSLNDKEIEYKNREKQLVYSKEIKAGEEITYSCLGFKICSEKSDFEQKDIAKIVGCKATKDLEKDKVVRFADTERC